MGKQMIKRRIESKLKNESLQTFAVAASLHFIKELKSTACFQANLCITGRNTLDKPKSAPAKVCSFAKLCKRRRLTEIRCAKLHKRLWTAKVCGKKYLSGSTCWETPQSPQSSERWLHRALLPCLTSRKCPVDAGLPLALPVLTSRYGCLPAHSPTESRLCRRHNLASQQHTNQQGQQENRYPLVRLNAANLG